MGVVSGEPVRLSKPQIDKFYETFSDTKILGSDGETVIGDGADSALAQQLVGRFASENPELFPGGYIGFRESQISGDFENHPLYKALSASDLYKGKPVSDVDIINLFARDEEGNPFQEGTFFGGMKRELFPSVFSLAGATAGAKAGSALTAAVPPVTMPTAAIKFGVPVFGAISGGLFGYNLGEKTADLAFGAEMPVSPGSRVTYEMGKTAMSGTGWASMPYLLGPKISLGGAEYLANYARAQATNPLKTGQAIIVSGKTGAAEVGKLKGLGDFGTEFRFDPRAGGTFFTPTFRGSRAVKDPGPRSARAVKFLEDMLGETGAAARRSPLTVGLGELGFTGGATLGAGAAESTAPGEALPRLAYEMLFGMPGGYAGVLGEKGSQLYTAAREGMQQQGGIKGVLKAFQAARRSEGVDRIVAILESQGYEPSDIDAIAKALSDESISAQLIDEATGKPIEMTAGLKSGDPVMMMIEAAIAQNSTALGQQRDTATEQAGSLIRNQINALILASKGEAGVNEQALQQVSQITYNTFTSGMTARLGRATDEVLRAYDQVVSRVDADGNPIDFDQTQLGERLFNVVESQIAFARRQEKALWQDVPDIDITTFRNADGDEIDTPNFLTAWDTSMPKTQEAAEDVESMLRPLAKFVDRKRTELGFTAPRPSGPTKVDKALEKITGTSFENSYTKLLTDIGELSTEDQVKRLREVASQNRGRFGNKRTRDYAALLDAKAEDLATPPPPPGATPSAPLTLTEVQDMRQKALSLAKSLTASGNLNEARIAYGFADGLLNDLNGLDDYADASYQAARAYSRALNDTFTRTFAADVLGTAKSGAPRIAPELLAERVLRGSQDAVLLRVDQLLSIPDFQRRFEVPGAGETPEQGAETVRTITGVVDSMLRNVRADAYRIVTDSDGREVKRINPDALKTYLSKNERLFGEDYFASLGRDLQDSAKAEVLLDETSALNKRIQAKLKDQGIFQNLLPESSESPIHAVHEAIRGNRGKQAFKRLNTLVGLTNNKNLSASQRDAAKRGLQSVMLEWAKTGSGLTGGSFDARTMYKNLFEPMVKGSDQTLMGYMEFRGLIDEAQVKRTKTLLTDLARIETASVNGNLVDIAKELGPMVDFYVSIAGSAAGTRAYNLLVGGSGPGAITAAGRGQQFLRDVFSKVPESMKMDVMGELMANPRLLGDLLSKPKTEREKLATLASIKSQFIELGFIRPVRREAGSVIRETDEEVEQQTFTVPEQPPVPVTQAPPAVAPAPQVPTQASVVPTMNLVSASPSAAPPQGTTVNRSRFAALFPEDRALIEGIGSLG
jgi:hypothetical protein